MSTDTEGLRTLRAIAERDQLARNTVLQLIERAHEANTAEATLAKVRELANSLAPFEVDIPAADLQYLLEPMPLEQGHAVYRQAMQQGRG